MSSQQLGRKLNKLRRYQLILELYNQYKTPDIPVSVVWRKYICPIYPISRTTLYEILGTAVNKELMRVEVHANLVGAYFFALTLVRW